MNDINKEFLKLSDKDQKAIINLCRFKNLLKEDSYKHKVQKAITTIEGHLQDKKNLNDIYTDRQIFNIVLDILKGDD